MGLVNQSTITISVSDGWKLVGIYALKVCWDALVFWPDGVGIYIFFYLKKHSLLEDSFCCLFVFSI